VTAAIVDASVRRYPVLKGLVDLHLSGWIFTADMDDEGNISLVKGIRPWPHHYGADALRVRSETDAAAMRDQHGLVWERTGTVSEVVDALLELPAPGALGAPCLVKGTERALWTPR
jgi:hypothetical protein